MQLLGAPGLTTRSKKPLQTPGIATRSKDATDYPLPLPRIGWKSLVLARQSSVIWPLRSLTSSRALAKSTFLFA